MYLCIYRRKLTLVVTGTVMNSNTHRQKKGQFMVGQILPLK